MMKMKDLMHEAASDPQYFEKSWKILENAVHEIYSHNASGYGFDELYRNAYILVLYNYGERLYSGLVTTVTAHVTAMAKSIESAQGDSFLEELNRKWAEHNTALQLIQDLLMYMDRKFVPITDKTPLYQLGMNLWRDNVIHSKNIQQRLIITLLELIQKERTGEVINGGLMRNTIRMLLDLGESVYQEDFEKPFLEESANFYAVESQKFMEGCDYGDYLKKVGRCVCKEIERVSHYLDSRSKSEIIKVVEREMIANHMPRLMEKSGLVKMLLDDKYEDLMRIYNLFCRVENCLSTIRDVMTSHIRETGKHVVTDPEWVKDPVEFVQRLLNEKDKYDKIISLAFNNDKNFQDDLKSSFEYLINLNPQSPEFISLFVDDKLRKGFKGVSKEDVEVVLDKVMMLFRCLQEKDVFRKYYEQHFAKRLLSGKTLSDDAGENLLIVKLKTGCGAQFTSKLEGMLTDMKTSQHKIQQFYASHGAELGDCPELVMKLLTTGSWSTEPINSCKLPAELSQLRDKFHSYYLGAYPGRGLSWQTSMGIADIKATFSKGQEYELNVSTFQMRVLMLFNNTDKLSYREIEQATEIPAPELKRCLQSLACVKGKNVLRKEPMSNNIGENDVFLFNDQFSSKFYEVNIETVVAQNESELQRQETRQRVETNRKPQIESAIVRIMKSRKVLDHKNLIAEVTKLLQSRFLPNPVEIKTRIESLIEREFLERDSADRNLYHYVP